MSVLSDPLFWTGIMAELPASTDGSGPRGIDPRAHEPDINDLRKRIDSIVPYFCPNPGCVQALCPYHRRRFIGLTLAGNNIFLPIIQHDITRLSHQPYPELRVRIIRKGRPVGACASGKSTRRLK